MSEAQDRRNAAARRLGYRNLHDQTVRRRNGDYTPADLAQRGERTNRARERFVTPLPGGRWQFFADVTTTAGVNRLQRNVERAAKNDRLRITGKVTGIIEGRRQTARFGGKGGVSGRYILDAGDGDALDGILALLARIDEDAGEEPNNPQKGGSPRRKFDEPDDPEEDEYPQVETVSLYVFPVNPR